MAEPNIRELAERYWTGEADVVGADHPVFPSRSRAAEELAPGLLYLKSLASVTAVDSGDGLVLLDTGGEFDATHVYEAVRGWRPSAPVRAAVFSHHHIDHVFGTRRFDEEARQAGQPAPLVYGHEAMVANFDRYIRTTGWNAAINQRQFALPVDGFDWPAEYRYPDVTYTERLAVRVGALTLELHHGLGETDDATWTWIPELGLLHPGDLFIWAVPNAGNPQKVQRYVSDWAAALRQMAGLGAELMVSGHGLPIFGADRIRAALLDTAELLDSIETQTLALMNQGKPLDQIIHQVEFPSRLLDKPYLRPVYDHPQFLVRNVWRRYGGWYDGEPDNLLPAPRRQQAEEWVALAGGVDAVVARARALSTAGDHRMACHLIEFAVLAEPASALAHELRHEIYRERAALQSSSMARNILNHAAHASAQGKRDLAGDY
jgi:glyoxylase-like metal-dependent hydrolase (beta-lactamase superfamily II)